MLNTKHEITIIGVLGCLFGQLGVWQVLLGSLTLLLFLRVHGSCTILTKSFG